LFQTGCRFLFARETVLVVKLIADRASHTSIVSRSATGWVKGIGRRPATIEGIRG
jgi:hypothetical protein